MSDAASGTDRPVHDMPAGRGRNYSWRHLRIGDRTAAALQSEEGLSASLAAALSEEDTLPRAARADGATLLILRGVNTAPDAEPGDMISVRLAVTDTRIVSAEMRGLARLDDLAAAIRDGRGPATADAFVMALVEMLREDAEEMLDRLEDRMAALEQAILLGTGSLRQEDRTALTEARRGAILLHRYILPQATALEALVRLEPDWMDQPAPMREKAEAFRRIAADLDTLRNRAQLLTEELAVLAADRTNRIVLTLSVVSVIFLPLTFLTGLLGVNLAGIPFAGAPWAFALFVGLLVIIAVGALMLAWRLLR